MKAEKINPEALKLAKRIFGGLLAKVTVINAAKEIQQYGDKVSRERACQFAHEMNSNKKPLFLIYYQDWYGDYDNWLKKKEE